MRNVVEFKKVSKVFGNKKAVNSVSFSVEGGETVAIIGPNGAGKSTTMMMMLGLLVPTEGEVTVFDGKKKEKEIKNRIGVMLQEVSMVDSLRVHEIIKLFRSYYTNPLPYDELVALTGFKENELKKMADKLSGGQKRRLGFALALVGNPDILFLDEPTVGMDISARNLFWRTIRRFKEKGKTIIFTTHYLQEADDVADRIILFSNGTVIADGTPQSIKANLSMQSVSFSVGSVVSFDEVRKLKAATNIYQKDQRIYVVTEDTDELLQQLFMLNVKLNDVQIDKGRLEQAFEELTAFKEVH